MNQNTIPQAVELEQSVIGTLIMEPDRLTEVVGILSPESFCDDRNSFIYKTLIEMFDQNTPVDLYNVGKRCDGSSLFGGRTGTLYASECTCKVGSGVNLLFQAQIIQQRYIARLLMYAGSKISTLAGDDTKDVADVLDESNKLIDKINALSCGSSAGQSLRDSLTESLKLAEQRQAAYLGGSPTGIPTGISDLNRLTGGWRGSQLIILAARPAMGKTALMLHFAKSAALNGTPVCIFSLEMSHVSLSDRLLLSECEVEVNRFRNGDLSGDDWRQLNEASAQLEKLPIHVDDNAVVSMRYIKTRCHILKKQGKCGLIMIDYLQLADTSTKERPQPGAGNRTSQPTSKDHSQRTGRSGCLIVSTLTGMRKAGGQTASTIGFAGIGRYRTGCGCSGIYLPPCVLRPRQDRNTQIRQYLYERFRYHQYCQTTGRGNRLSRILP